jgi:hypothetical protein
MEVQMKIYCSEECLNFNCAMNKSRIDDIWDGDITWVTPEDCEKYEPLWEVEVIGGKD